MLVGMSGTRDVAFVVFDGMKLLDVAGPAEVFAEANRFGASYRIVFASVDGKNVNSSIGTRFAVTTSISSVESVDTAVVSGGDELVGHPIDPELVAAVKELRQRVRRMASICTGSFILAQAGILDGRRATTHWRRTGLLSRAFPQVRVEADAIFVRDGDIYTSAGVSAGIDLALALVEDDHGADLVRDVARSLVVYLKRAGGQSQFSALVEAPPPRRPQLRALPEAVAAEPRRRPFRGKACSASIFEHASTDTAVPDRSGRHPGPLCRDDPHRRRALGARCRTLGGGIGANRRLRQR